MELLFSFHPFPSPNLAPNSLSSVLASKRNTHLKHLILRTSLCWNRIFRGTVGVYGAHWLCTCSVCMSLLVLEGCQWLPILCINQFLIHRLRHYHCLRFKF